MNILLWINSCLAGLVALVLIFVFVADWLDLTDSQPTKTLWSFAGLTLSIVAQLALVASAFIAVNSTPHIVWWAGLAKFCLAYSVAIYLVYKVLGMADRVVFRQDYIRTFGREAGRRHV